MKYKIHTHTLAETINLENVTDIRVFDNYTKFYVDDQHDDHLPALMIPSEEIMLIERVDE